MWGGGKRAGADGVDGEDGRGVSSAREGREGGERDRGLRVGKEGVAEEVEGGGGSVLGGGAWGGVRGCWLEGGDAKRAGGEVAFDGGGEEGGGDRREEGEVGQKVEEGV